MEDLKLNEATIAGNIEQTDQNLTVDQMFQQANIESLAKKVCSVLPLNGPSGGLFNVRQKEGTNDFELIRRDVQIFDKPLIRTTISQEAIQDIRNIYGKEADKIIGRLFRGISNDSENNELMTFLDIKCKDYGSLTLSDSLNAELNLFEITQRVHELILKMNQKTFRTYEAFAIVPAEPLGGIMGLRSYAGAEDKDENGLFVAQLGQTKFYLNPNTNDKYVYVGLKDSENPSRSSIVFSPYQQQILETVSQDEGHSVYFLSNRFAITESPLHILNNEMLYKFEIVI